MTLTCLHLSSPDMLGHLGSDLVHPDEFPVVWQLHYGTIHQDKAAVLAYL
ncbi:hypothetical protein BKA83DRAFT_4363302 [Pisolithus microcarpus]|nr:hypothetical protein BKA83DRAFT_4363302 [Pisolithus microcarpus]